MEDTKQTPPMKTILSLMSFSEMLEHVKLKHTEYEKIKRIIEKPFIYVNVVELSELAKTDIFDSNFTDILFNDLWMRYTNETDNIK